MSDSRNSSNNIRGGGSKQTGGKSRTDKKASKGPGSATTTGDDSHVLAQIEHAQNQQTAKDIARVVIKELLREIDFKTSTMEMPTQLLAMRRMKAEEKRKVGQAKAYSSESSIVRC